MAASNPRALGGSARFSRWPGTLLMAVLFALVVWGRGTAQIDAARESVDSGQLVGILADPLHV